jgi:hypothetical protein
MDKCRMRAHMVEACKREVSGSISLTHVCDAEGRRSQWRTTVRLVIWRRKQGVSSRPHGGLGLGNNWSPG